MNDFTKDQAFLSPKELLSILNDLQEYIIDEHRRRAELDSKLKTKQEKYYNTGACHVLMDLRLYLYSRIKINE